MTCRVDGSTRCSPIDHRIAAINRARRRWNPARASTAGAGQLTTPNPPRESPLADGLRRVDDSGGLTPGTDPVVLAGGLFAAYQGGMLLADVSGDVDPLRRALHTAVAAGLAPTVSA